MNWLGEIIQKHIGNDDIVLDLGCGIMQATTGIYDKGKSLKCKTIVGVELQEKYITRVKNHYPTIHSDVLSTKLFIDKSYDVVICLDVLEHLPLPECKFLLKDMKRIARKCVIIYTPKEFHKNDDNVENAWDMGENELQEHQCLVTEEILNEFGYETKLTTLDMRNFSIKMKVKGINFLNSIGMDKHKTMIDNNILGVWKKD